MQPGRGGLLRGAGRALKRVMSCFGCFRGEVLVELRVNANTGRNLEIARTIAQSELAVVQAVWLFG